MMPTQSRLSARVGLSYGRDNFAEESLNSHSGQRGGSCAIILPGGCE